MKTIEELYKEIFSNKELKEQCAEAIKNNKLEEFLKKQGCEVTIEEIKAFLDSKKEVDVDELDMVAGGCDTLEAIASAFSAGIACAVAAAISAGAGGKVSVHELCSF